MLGTRARRIRGYNGSDDLTSITTPATPDQSGGIVTTLGYASGVLTSVIDGRGNTAFAATYTSGKVTSVAIDGITTAAIGEPTAMNAVGSKRRTTVCSLVGDA